MNIIGIDPGLSGGLAIMDPSGQILSVCPMPRDQSGVCRVGLAELYNKWAHEYGEARLVIERIFTKPTDAVSKEQIRSLARLRIVAMALHNGVVEGEVSQDLLEALKTEITASEGLDPDKLRLDGRAGNLSYAKGAGLLEMPALWGWPIETVSPRTWMADIKRGAPVKLAPKEQSIYCAKQLWPKEFGENSRFRPGKMRTYHDGMVESCLIAEWGRRRHCLARSA